MQIICRTLNLTTANQSQSLATLLTAAGVALPQSQRVAGVKLSASGHDLYIVDREMAVYPMTNNVPNSYGFKIQSGHASVFEESQHPANQISLSDIVVVSDSANAKLHLWAYCV